MARTMQRNSKGRFVKGARRSSSRKSTAIVHVRRGSSAVTKTRTRTIVVKAKRRGRRRGGGGASWLGPRESGGMMERTKRRIPAGVASAVYAYATVGKSAKAKELQTYVKKIPTVEAIGAPATHAILFTAIACNTSGALSQVADLLGQAAFHQAFHNLGASDFDHEAAAKLGGVDDDGSDDVQMGGMNG